MVMNTLVIKEFKDILEQELPPFPLCFIAHPDFAPQYGVRYYQVIQEECQKRWKTPNIYLAIACYDSPRLALEAIAASVDRLYFLKESPYWSKIDSLCRQANILLFDQEGLQY